MNTKEKTDFCSCVVFVFRSMEKIAWDGPKWGREGLFPTNPDLVDILGDINLDFENSHFFMLGGSKFLEFQVAIFPKAGPGLELFTFSDCV